MPLLRRRPVVLLNPPPGLESLDGDVEAFYLRATGEIFLDYESYSNRLSYLLSRIFQCEFSGKTNLDYFSALESEKAESRVVRERFPDELKGKVLASIQFQVMGRLDNLVDLVYERYKDRFFVGEKVFVDLAGDKYFARISRVFPPPNIRRLADIKAQKDPSSIPASQKIKPEGGESPPPATHPTSSGLNSHNLIGNITTNGNHHKSSSSENGGGETMEEDSEDPEQQYAKICHVIGTDLNRPPAQAKAEDEAEEYLYTVQLMDEEHKFEGSFMEVKAKTLSRDRLAFSKSILKRYLRECVQRDALIASPWIVKPAIAAAFGIPQFQSEEGELKNKEIREGKLAKRRKLPRESEDGAVVPKVKVKKTRGRPSATNKEGVNGEKATEGEGAAEGEGEGGEQPPRKRKKRRTKLEMLGLAEDGVTPLASLPNGGITKEGTPVVAVEPPPPKRVPPEPKKMIKYPIEDLELDPMSIHDGRVLRRINSDLPSLPPKPKPSKNLLVPKAHFDTLIMIWNSINIFSKPLIISTFTLDDFVAALRHSTLDPPCALLAEIHACLTNMIGADASRVLGSSGASVVILSQGKEKSTGQSPDPLALEDELEEEEEEVDQLELPDSTVDNEFDSLIRKGISYSKKWDRSTKLRYQDGRQGWVRHLVGCLCQRGGPTAVLSLPRILRHLFEGADLTHTDMYNPEDSASVGTGSAEGGTGGGMPQSSQLSDLEDMDPLDPEAQYLTLALEDKLDILAYLCTLALGSKAIRTYIDECETNLTEFRKHRAEVNKERRAILEQKAILEGKTVPKPEQEGNEEGVIDGQGSLGETTLGREISQDVGDDSINPHHETNGKEMALPSAPPSDVVEKIEGQPGEDEPEEEEDEEEERNPEDDEEIDQLADDDEEDEVEVAKVGRGEEDDLMEDSDLEDEAGNASAQASDTGGSEGVGIGSGSALAARRRAALEEKRLERLAIEASRTSELAKARQEARLKSAGKKEAEKLRAALEESLRANSKKDDWVEREFRRYQGVSRCRPLGRDRFYNRYWWFDGIGGMNLVGSGNSVVYGTGRLFVQGPSKEDWEYICNGRIPGEDEIDQTMEQRRLREEVDVDAILDVNEWAFYEEDDDLDQLQGWFNAKGIREVSLKNALSKWRGYILAGARKRQNDAQNPFRASNSNHTSLGSDTRRSTRRQTEIETWREGYLAWSNKLAKQ